MEPKKTVRADLTRKSFLFFNVGLVTALSLAIFAFTFKTEENGPKSHLVNNQGLVEDLLEVPVTEQLPPPAPKIENPKIIEVINEEKIEDDLNIDLDMEKTPEEPNEAVMQVTAEIEEEDPNTLFTIVEESAEPVGGIDEFNAFVARNIVYPSKASRMDIGGRVFVEFVVERDGSITNIKTIRGIGAGCDEEAVRVVGIAPKWNPGKQRGKPVRQKIVVPINFKAN